MKGTGSSVRGFEHVNSTRPRSLARAGLPSRCPRPSTTGRGSRGRAVRITHRCAAVVEIRVPTGPGPNPFGEVTYRWDVPDIRAIWVAASSTSVT